jgi:ABC-type uncharacterized transport system ATPase subunit
MSDVVLEIKNLTRRFGTFTAVDALTLSVNAGEVFGLLGSNGAGIRVNLSQAVGQKLSKPAFNHQAKLRAHSVGASIYFFILKIGIIPG